MKKLKYLLLLAPLFLGSHFAYASDSYTFGTSGVFPPAGANGYTGWAVLAGDQSNDVVSGNCVNWIATTANNSATVGNPYVTNDFFTYASLTAGTYTLILFKDVSCTGPGFGYTKNPDYYQVLHWDGTNAFPPGTPAGDSSLSTHVMSVDVPQNFATTSSPVPITFTILNASSSPATGYDLEFTNYRTRAYVKRSGWLVDSGFSSDFYNVPFSVATSSPLVGDGTWALRITLWEGGNGGPAPDPIGTQYGYYYPSGFVAFGLNYNDNVTSNDVGTCTETVYASTTCAFNLNPFAESTFDASGCISYLTQPSCDTMLKFNNLTLAHSAPFSYAYDIPNLRRELFNASSSGSTTIAVTVNHFGTITFLSRDMIAGVPFSSTIKTVLAALMWLLVCELIYLSVIRSHNNNTGV